MLLLSRRPSVSFYESRTWPGDEVRAAPRRTRDERFTYIGTEKAGEEVEIGCLSS